MEPCLDLPRPPVHGPLAAAEARLQELVDRRPLHLSLRGTPGAGLERHARAFARARGRDALEVEAATEREALEPALSRAAEGAALVAVEPSLWSPAGQARLAEALRGGVLETAIACQTLAPEAELEAGRLEHDLFYALNARTCCVPGLGDWGAELWPQVEGLMERLERRLRPGQPPRRLDPGARGVLERSPWPGDRLGLEARLTAAAAAAGATLELDPGSAHARPANPAGSPGGTLRTVERDLIASALRDCDGNRSRAAKRLGLGRSTLYAKLDAYGLR